MKKYLDEIISHFRVLICLIVGVYLVLFIAKSCSIDEQTPTQNTGTGIEIRAAKKIEILYDRIEELEKKDSTYQEKIKQIDSIRNELDVVIQSIDEQYSYLSDRYNNDKQGKKR